MQILVMLAAAAVFSAPVIPIHGTSLGKTASGLLVVRTDGVTGMLAPQTRAYRISPTLDAPPGTGIDAFLDRSRSPWRLYDAAIAGQFVPGMPEAGRVFPIDYGSMLPHTRLVDQTGRLIDLGADFRGKVTIVSFVFTRCPDKDECPAVSAKFAALQRILDGRRFHLIELTLDPAYDSPWVLARYAAEFGANASKWSIVTGQPHDVQHLLDRFGISSLRVSDADFVHNDKIFLGAPDGKIADVIQTVGFSPEALAAQARHIAGASSNPFERWKLAIIASAVALCGGSQFAGVVLLETVTFLIIATICLATLGWIARRMWHRA